MIVTLPAIEQANEIMRDFKNLVASMDEEKIELFIHIAKEHGNTGNESELRKLIREMQSEKS